MMFPKYLLLISWFYFSTEVAAAQTEKPLPKFPQKECTKAYLDTVTSLSFLGIDDLQVELKWGPPEKIVAPTGYGKTLALVWFSEEAILHIGHILDDEGRAEAILSELMDRNPEEVYAADFEFDEFAFLLGFDKSRDIYYEFNFAKREIYLAGFQEHEKNMIIETILILQPEEKKVVSVLYRYPGRQIEWLSLANLCPIKQFGR